MYWNKPDTLEIQAVFSLVFLLFCLISLYMISKKDNNE